MKQKMEFDYKLVGERIKRMRESRGLTQENLAETSGFSNSHISNVENGWTKVSLEGLVRIANALDVSSDELLRDNLKKSKDEFEAEVVEDLKDCSVQETQILTDTLKALKKSLRVRKWKGVS